ncbi:MAG: ankyrin repeat domain-containing protein [Verrucomicrobiaceae bacterium]|nr:ankyrin repeat domain-containing protein [Verrucomicrobiaceae bacterium]
MPANRITRAQLLQACKSSDADLLDKLLEIDASRINDNALFTDTWGSWWGMLVHAISANWIDGVKVLLKHNADRNAGTWGDGQTFTALEHAADNPEILALLQNPERPVYARVTDPPVPDTSPADTAVNRQGEVAERTGLVFQVPE